MSTVEIRRMREKDIPATIAIRESITKKKVPKFWQHEIAIRLLESDNQCFVATFSKKVVGFIIGETKTLDFGVTKSGWLVDVGIDPNYMGQGIGKKLGKAMLRGFNSKGINRIFTAVRWDSSDLLAFFKSIGFERSEFINLERRMRK
ncbi:MAG: N-acetyltransferase [Methanomassiliicoccales archaeon]|nr:MAG: N-acetyltransferase [Methanomassiliicoccales archaeon]